MNLCNNLNGVSYIRIIRIVCLLEKCTKTLVHLMWMCNHFVEPKIVVSGLRELINVQRFP